MDESTTSTPTRSGGKSESSAVMVTPEGTEDNNDRIKEPSENDVLCGRGGSINAHPGNERFRQLVEKRKRVYLTARFKREKRLIASSIVTEIRGLDPPGRFLTRDGKSGLWYDIGDEKARDKTSQALRENAPSIRAEIETEINEQRAELHRAEQENVPSSSSALPPHGPHGHHPHHPHHHHHHPPGGPSPPPGPYYPSPTGGWGYYSYYGYAQQPNPHPPAPHPPPPHPSAYPGEPPYSDGNCAASPWPSTFISSSTPATAQSQSQSPRHDSATGPQRQDGHYYVPDDQKSAFEQTVEQTADLVSSVPSHLKKWTESSFSFGAGPVPSNNSNDNDDATEVGSVQSKPIVYVHQPEQQQQQHRHPPMPPPNPNGRRSVHFRDEKGVRNHLQRPPRMSTSNIQLRPNLYPKKARRSNKNGAQGSQNFSGSNQMHQYYNNGNNNYNPNNPGAGNYVTNDGMNSLVDEGMSSIVEEDYGHKSFVDEDAPLEDEVESSPDGGRNTHGTRQSSLHHNHPDDQTQGTSASVLSQMASSIFSSLGSFDPSFFDSSVGGSSNQPNREREREGAFPDSQSVVSGGNISRTSMMSGGNLSRMSALSGGNFSRSSFFSGGNSTKQSRQTPRQQQQDAQSIAMSAISKEDTMAVEIEGQEVQLYDDDVDMMDQDHNGTIDTTFPIESRVPLSDNNRYGAAPDQKFEIDWPSRVGSCHSWIPDTLGAASFFSKGSNVSPVGSMEMEFDGGSITGSIGGGSLCKVFDPEAASASNANQSVGTGGGGSGRSLSQGPSWDRSFRSRSPVSVNDDDDESLVSKGSEKLMMGSGRSVNSGKGNMDAIWGGRKE